MRFLALTTALLAFTFAASGCDSNDPDEPDDNLLEELGELEEDLQDNYDCDTARRVLANSTTNGTLSDTDCSFSSDAFYFDVYTFALNEDSDVEIEFESDDFDIYVTLLDDDLDFVDDGFASEGETSDIDDDLNDGVYAIIVESKSFEGGGSYRLTLTSEEE